MNEFELFKKENDVKLHQIFYMKNLYWFDSKDDCGFELILDYDEWVSDWYFEMLRGFQSHSEPNVKERLLEEVNNAWEQYRFDILKWLS